MFKSALQHRSNLGRHQRDNGPRVRLPLAVANGINLVPNPGFENGFTNWDCLNLPAIVHIHRRCVPRFACADSRPVARRYYNAAMKRWVFQPPGRRHVQLRCHQSTFNTCDTYNASDTIFDLGLSTASQWLCWIADPSEPPASPSWRDCNGNIHASQSVDVHMAVKVHGYATGRPRTRRSTRSPSLPSPSPPRIILLGIGAITLLGYAWRRVRYPVS